MLRLVFMFLITHCVLCAYGQSYRWNPKDFVYSNFEYAFSWSLPTDMDWEKISGTEKHTIFKAYQPDTYITVVVNVNQIQHEKAKDISIWDFYDTIVSQSKQIDKYIEENTGNKTIKHTFEKCMFCGQKAYKTYHHTFFQDDRYEEPYEIITIAYSYAYRGFTYMASVKVHKSLYELDEIKSYINEIFRGYSIVNQYN